MVCKWEIELSIDSTANGQEVTYPQRNIASSNQLIVMFPSRCCYGDLLHQLPESFDAFDVEEFGHLLADCFGRIEVPHFNHQVFVVGILIDWSAGRRIT